MRFRWVALAAVLAFGFVPHRTRAERARVEAAAWPPIPPTVQGLGGPITVKLMANPKDEEGADLWGSWEVSTRTIEIDASAPLEFQWHTLGHELCHAALGDSGHEYLLEEKQAEALCDALGSARVQEMRK